MKGLENTEIYFHTELQIVEKSSLKNAANSKTKSEISKNVNELGASLFSGILGLGSHFARFNQLFLVS